MKYALTVLLMWLCGFAIAAPELVITHPWIRAMPPGSHMNAAYLVVENRGSSEVTIVGADSPVAQSLSLHHSVAQAGMSHMQAVSTVVLKAGATKIFAPQGLHLMLNSVTKLLVAGDKVPLCLIFAREDGSRGRACQQFPVSKDAPNY